MKRFNFNFFYLANKVQQSKIIFYNFTPPHYFRFTFVPPALHFTLNSSFVFVLFGMFKL